MTLSIIKAYFQTLLLNGICILYASACSSSQEEEQPSFHHLPPGLTKEDNVDISLDGTVFPNFGYTLRGYNVLLGNPYHADTVGDPGFRNRIFKVDNIDKLSPDQTFKLPNGIDIHPKKICKLDSTMKETSNEKDYQKDLLFSAGLNAPLPDIIPELLSLSFTANVEFQNHRHSMSKNRNIFIRIENTCTVYEVELLQNEPPKFTNGFLRAAKRLENTSDTKAYKNFVEDFGTHYLTGAHVGARYAVTSELEREKREDFSHEGHNLNVGANLDFLSIFEIKAHLNSERNMTEKEMFQSLRKEKTIIAYGSPIPEDGDMTKWANEVRKNPLPIEYKLSKITNLFDERFMENLENSLNYHAIQKQMATYLDTYCQNEKQNLGLSKCSPPSGGCKGGNDCHSNAECIDNTNGNGLSEYTCRCKEGYQGNGKECSSWHEWQRNLTHDRYKAINDQSSIWGEWQKEELCPENEFAYQFALKVEPHLGHGSIRDDSALNGVKLYCKPKNGKRGGQISSGIGAYGSWTAPVGCLRDEEFLDGFRFQSRVTPIIKDNWFGENIEFTCQGRNERLNAESEKSVKGAWVSKGQWSSVEKCQGENSAICGVQTKIYPQNPNGWQQDEVGLTDVKFLCCAIE